MDSPAATPAAPVSAPEPKWNLYVILPSLGLTAKDNPFRTEFMQIVSGDDPALAKLSMNTGDETMTRLCERFASHYGDKYRPACLLIRADSPDVLRSGEAISTFRNACCVATVTFATHYAIKGESWRWEQAHSDHFMFAPEIALKDGKGVFKVGAIVSGWTDEVDTFHGHPSHLIEKPTSFSLNADAVLLERLFRVWRSVHLGGVDTAATRRLFRAMEVAFHAARYPNVSLGTRISDVGTRIGLWVSAFEILCRGDGEGRVKKLDVLEALARTEWAADSPLRDKRFGVWMSRERGVEGATFVEKVYDEIYTARNAFMHGNPVTNESLKLKCVPGGGLLAAYAPVLFNIALRSFLAKDFPHEPSEDEEFADGWLYFDEIERTLRAAMGEPEAPP
jgi:hypothetical protein